jgi:hypothetical protein
MDLQAEVFKLDIVNFIFADGIQEYQLGVKKVKTCRGKEIKANATNLDINFAISLIRHNTTYDLFGSVCKYEMYDQVECHQCNDNIH